jgi:hypothetical protein
MKKTKMALSALAIAATGLFSFHSLPVTSLKGKVTPAKYGVHAWAISESDTLYTTVRNGSFEFTNARPGVYRIVIEARLPYRHTAKDNVVVKEGQATDVGEISLKKNSAVIK